MVITLFSTGCPKCNVLKQKLDQKELKYDIVYDVDQMMKLGFMSAPILKVENDYMEFADAIKWVNAR